MNRPQYMSPPMYGYALALVAWCRKEEKPDWAKYLTGDSLTCFKHALRYLRETGDSKFTPKVDDSDKNSPDMIALKNIVNEMLEGKTLGTEDKNK